ncbi:MAG: helix-hairpin-helix domain-containing protein [Nitrospira sp.]
MIRSLLFKLGMLFVSMGVSFWMIWHAQSPSPRAGAIDEKPAEVVPISPVLHDRTPTVETIGEKAPTIQPDRRLLDLNRASAGELESLPGIGAVMAQRVIAFRESTGGFRTLEELRAVKGIGPKKFDRLKSFVTVSTAKSKQVMEQRG